MTMGNSSWNWYDEAASNLPSARLLSFEGRKRDNLPNMKPQMSETLIFEARESCCKRSKLNKFKFVCFLLFEMGICT